MIKISDDMDEVGDELVLDLSQWLEPIFELFWQQLLGANVVDVEDTVALDSLRKICHIMMMRGVLAGVKYSTEELGMEDEDEDS